MWGATWARPRSSLRRAGTWPRASRPWPIVEGSYGTLLLVEDVSDDGLRFGHGGEAPLLTGPGWGVGVRVDRLRRHAVTVVELAG